MKNLGIWIDKRKAVILSLENGKEQSSTVFSNIEDFNIKGGSGTKFKGGPQDVVQDSKYLEREKHQTKAFFKEVVGVVKDADAIVIFGPAQMGNRFYEELNKNYNSVYSKVKSIEPADSMTDKQIAAWVRSYFNTAKK